MCTPVEQIALSVGFLYNEKIISSLDEILDYRLCASGDNVDIWLNRSVQKPSSWRRTSGCTGGMTSLSDDLSADASQAVNPNGLVISAPSITDHINQLFNAQELYRQSGGVHTSGLSDGKSIYLSAEDIGRHNSLDKIAGLYILKELHLPRRVIVTTGRISSEMLQKSARMRCSVVISRTAASSLAVNLANQLGITLIGYTRRNSFNIYTHSYRIILEKQAKVTRHTKS
jgi:FdhD protein